MSWKVSRSAMSCEGVDTSTFTEDINAYYSINFPNLRQGMDAGLVYRNRWYCNYHLWSGVSPTVLEKPHQFFCSKCRQFQETAPALAWIIQNKNEV